MIEEPTETIPSFVNGQRMVADLPSVNDVTYQPLDPAYFWTSAAMWALTVLVVMAVSLIIPSLSFLDSEPKEILPRIGGIATAGLFIAAVLNVWEIKVRGYAMRDHDILYRKGLVWRAVTVVPFSRVQHVETHRGPIDRLAGLSELKIYTAGGASSDLKVPGLKIGEASALRQSILNHAYEDKAGIALDAAKTEDGSRD